jgi:outer membrane biosynthesis protein TonB
MRLPLPPSTAASLAVHTLIIALAVLATARPGHTRPGPEHVIPIPVFRPPRSAPTTSRSTATGGTIRGGHGDGLPAPPPTVDVPAPGPTQVGSGYSLDTTWSAGTPQRQPGSGSTDQPETAGAVDVAAVAIPGTPPPTYPTLMREAGISARLTVQFIVDTTGHAGAPTVLAADVGGDTRDAFLSSIVRSLAHTRFRPATIGGRPVRQLVQQEFDFVSAAP